MKPSRPRAKTLIASSALAALAGAFLGIYLAHSASTRVPEEESNPKPATRLSAQTLDPEAAKKVHPLTPLQAALQSEHAIAAIDPAEFPALIETELRDATTSDRAFRLATVWSERDPEGFIAWLRQRSGRFTLQEAGHGLGLSSTLIDRLARDDPERAWQVAGELPGSSDSTQMRVVSTTLIRDPEQALALVRNHRDAVSAANTGTGFWGQTDPLTTVALAKELTHGRARESIIRDAVAYFRKDLGNVPESKIWFAELTPELQAIARRAGSHTHFGSADVMKAMLEAWDEADVDR